MRRFLGLLALALTLVRRWVVCAPSNRPRRTTGPPSCSCPTAGCPKASWSATATCSTPARGVTAASTPSTWSPAPAACSTKDAAAVSPPGLKFDSRTGYIFASGASAGDLNVIDSNTGNRVATFKLAQTPGPTFINDVILTTNAAYATDSNRPLIYKIPLGVDGKLSTQDDVVIIPLSGDYQHQTGLNLNGIEATPSGDGLIGVQTGTGKLFMIDPTSGKTTLIEVNGPVNGDGLLRIDRTLYAVRNTAGNSALLRIEMSANFLSGTIVSETKDSAWDTPTTAALGGNRIYMVNSRFTAGMAPTVKYWITSVDVTPVPGISSYDPSWF